MTVTENVRFPLRMRTRLSRVGALILCALVTPPIVTALAMRSG
jgi:branched-subunit amino acid transport protein